MLSNFSDIGRENADARGSTMIINQRKVLENRRITGYLSKNSPNST